ncbi:hypothetical protein Esti_001675 [Eimeria stiedai]
MVAAGNVERGAAASLMNTGQRPRATPAQLVRSLESFSLDKIGTREWVQQQQTLERLSALLHEEALSGGPETTQRLFCDEAKVGMLIEELISLDVWNENVRPHIKETKDLSSLAMYLPAYQEGLIGSMLETLLFHSAAAAAADAQLPDLVEYCNRKLQRLLLRCAHSSGGAATSTAASTAAAAAGGTTAQVALEAVAKQQEEQQDAAAFASEVSAVSLLRFICDHRKHLPMTVTTLLLNQYDVLLTLTGLLEEQPWKRQTADGRKEVYEDHQWRPAEQSDVRITKTAAQVWLAAHSLIMDPECRQRYELTQFRKDNMLRLRRHLNEVVYDQIPPLKDLHKYLEELALGCAGFLPASSKTSLLISVQPEFREQLLQQYKGNWKSLAAAARRHLSSSSSGEQEALRGVASLMASRLELIVARCRRCGLKVSCG